MDFDDDNDEPQRLGELVPPIVVTALDAAKNDYKLTDLPPELTLEIVEQPQGQQVRIDESELGRVIENGKVRLEGLKLRGTLADGKGVGKVKLGIKMGELPVVTGNVKIKCGRPAQLTLLNPNDFAAALDADARLPRLRLRCDDEDGNPASNMTVTLVQEHDGDATSEAPFEHTGKGPSGEGDDAFETKANGEIDIGPKHAAFIVNKEVLQADREVQAKLVFAAKLVR